MSNVIYNVVKRDFRIGICFLIAKNRKRYSEVFSARFYHRQRQVVISLKFRYTLTRTYYTCINYFRINIETVNMI